MTDNPYASSDPGADSPKQKRRRGFTWLELLVVVCIIVVLICLMLPLLDRSSSSAWRADSKGDLEKIAIALREYESIHHALPPTYTVDSAGKPNHSWRTLILPYLELEELYATIDLSKSWDDPANAHAYNKEMSEVFRCAIAGCRKGNTPYLAIVAPDSCFRINKPRHYSEITDDHAKTLMVIEVDAKHSVHWMAPQDADEQFVLKSEPKSKLRYFGGTFAAFVDGHVEFLDAETPAAEVRAMISISGNDN